MGNEPIKKEGLPEFTAETLQDTRHNMNLIQGLTAFVLFVLILRYRKDRYRSTLYADLAACLVCLGLHIFSLPDLALGLALAYVVGVFWFLN